jgi:hypothetical protein
MASHGASAQPARTPEDARCLVQLGTESRRAEQEATLERGRELDVHGRIASRCIEAQVDRPRVRR